MMGWMDAHEYLVMERALNDRLDDVERFSLERAFHSEAGAGDDAPPAPDRRAWTRPRTVDRGRSREGPA
jgi:hypothetical protein